MGPAILLYVPRLPLMLALLVGIYVLLWRDGRVQESGSARYWPNVWPNYAWAAGMAAVAVLGVRSTLQLQRAVRQEYTYRLPLQPPTFLDANASSAGGRTPLHRLHSWATLSPLLAADQDERPVDLSSVDELSFTANSSNIWVEKARSPRSQIVSVQEPGRVFVDDAREPMLSADGQSLAFIRDDHGRVGG